MNIKCVCMCIFVYVCKCVMTRQSHTTVCCGRRQKLLKATNDLYDFKVEEEKVPQNLEILVMLQRFLVIQDHRITLFSDCAKSDIFLSY